MPDHDLTAERVVAIVYTRCGGGGRTRSVRPMLAA